MKTKLIVASLATLGVIDTAYLTLEHFSNFVPPCPVHPTLLIDCGAVLRSQYATVYGIPLTLFGLAYYLAILTLAFFSWKKLLLPLSIAGLATSILLLYLQLFVIKSICLYCTASGAINLIILILVAHDYLHSSRILASK